MSVMTDAMLAVTVARNRLDNAEGLDEIEAAIYELRAAEIRLNSTIKRAKQEGGSEQCLKHRTDSPSLLARA